MNNFVTVRMLINLLAKRPLDEIIFMAGDTEGNHFDVMYSQDGIFPDYEEITAIYTPREITEPRQELKGIVFWPSDIRYYLDDVREDDED